MTSRPNDPLLALAHIAILILQAIAGAAIAVLALGIPFVIFGRELILAEIREETGKAVASFPSWEVAAVMLVWLVAALLAFLFLRKLRAIIETVGKGDPFVPVNADRLTAMGWLMVAIQALAIAAVPLIVLIQQALEETNPTMETDFDLGAVVLAITLFILARVFRHGAAMREDLEGTV